MAVALRHVLSQGPMIAALGRTAIATLRGAPDAVSRTVPGPWIEARLPPPSPALVHDYVRHVGGDPSSYRGRLPAHLFPQWGMPLAAAALAPLGYPVARAMNAGCRIQTRGPLPAGETLEVAARVESIDDDGRRAAVVVRIVTGTRSAPQAVTADARVFIRLGQKVQPNGGRANRGGGANGGRGTRVTTLVPERAREIAFVRLRANAGLDFAKLTGDFNPVHWVPAYARASGFKGCIAHGFSTIARAIEALHRGRFSGDSSRPACVDARLVAPILLPASVGVYVTNDGGFWVGDAPGGRAYLDGHHTTEPTA